MLRIAAHQTRNDAEFCALQISTAPKCQPQVPSPAKQSRSIYSNEVNGKIRSWSNNRESSGIESHAETSSPLESHKRGNMGKKLTFIEIIDKELKGDTQDSFNKSNCSASQAAIREKSKAFRPVTNRS